jgi:hypothetical protein
VTATIVCPTHGRAGRVKPFSIFGDDLLLCVQEGEQAELYRDAYPDADLLIHPEMIGVNAKRQWLYEQLGDCFMIDDDVEQLLDHTVPPGKPSKVTDPQRARDIVQRTADHAEAIGSYLFGFAQNPSPMVFKPQEPFRLKGLITGAALGIRAGSKLWFPKDLHGSGDLWISALNAYHHRFLLIDQRYVFPNVGTFQNTGGLASVRTTANLERNLERLKESFGDAIYARAPKGGYGKASAWAVNLKVPW